MCDYCVKHGVGGKWYLKAESYSNEIAEKYNLRDFLLISTVDGFHGKKDQDLY